MSTMSGENSKAIRTRTTVGQWITALAAIITAGAVVWIALLHTAVLDSLGDTGPGFGQGLKEVVCVPYANAVLELAKDGYNADQIAAVYRTAALPLEGDERDDQDIPESYAMEVCGTPAEVLTAAK